MRNVIFTLIAVLALAACSSSGKEITPTDFAKYQQTVATNDEEAIEIGGRFREECQRNTIGRSLPHITVSDTEGKRHDLRKLVTRESIIIAGYDIEGYGKEEFVASFPETIRSLEDVPGDFDVFCLVIDSGDDNDDLITDLLPNYRNIFIISGEEASKLNIFSNPTKLYLNKEKTVVNYSMGYVIEDQYRLQEADEGIKQMFKKRL